MDESKSVSKLYYQVGVEFLESIKVNWSTSLCFIILRILFETLALNRKSNTFKKIYQRKNTHKKKAVSSCRASFK